MPLLRADSFPVNYIIGVKFCTPLKSKRKNKNKLDMLKAYDRMEWDFGTELKLSKSLGSIQMLLEWLQNVYC